MRCKNEGSQDLAFRPDSLMYLWMLCLSRSRTSSQSEGDTSKTRVLMHEAPTTSRRQSFDRTYDVEDRMIDA
jgi:hypothetical protein